MAWFPDLGYEDDLIYTNVTGEIIIGDQIETISGTAVIQSNVSDSILSEVIQLHAWNTAQSITWGTLGYQGEFPELSSTVNIKTHTSIPDMVIGLNPEILYSVANIQTDVSATMRQNYKEIFSGTVKIRSELYGFVDEGCGEQFTDETVHIKTSVNTDSGFVINLVDLKSTSKCKVISNVRNSKLTCYYNIHPVCHIQTNCHADLFVGTMTPLSSSCYGFTNVTGNMVYEGYVVNLSSHNKIKVSCGGWAYIGTTEVLLCVDYGVIIQTKVENTAPLDTNIKLLNASSLISTSTTCELYLGQDELLTSSCNINTSASTHLNIGRDEVLTSISETITNVISELTLGLDTSLSSTSNIITNSSCDLFIGTSTDLSSSIFIFTNTTSNLSTGDIVPLNSNILISSQCQDSELVIGHDELLSSNCNIQSDIIGNIVPGIVEILSSSLITTTSTSSLLVIGINEVFSSTCNISINVSDSNILTGENENLSSSCLIQTNVNSNLTLGEYDYFSATVDIKTACDSFLDIGCTENFTTTSKSVSNIIDSELTLGQFEELSSTCNIGVSISPEFLEIGVATNISGTVNLSSITTCDTLVIGINTELSCHNVSLVNVTGFLGFGVKKPLSGHLDISSDLQGILYVGRDEYFGSYIAVRTSCQATLTLGKEEHIRSSCVVVTSSICTEFGLSFKLVPLICNITTNVTGFTPSLQIELTSNNLIQTSVLNPNDYTFEIINSNGIRRFTYDLPAEFAKVVIHSNLNRYMIPFGSEYTGVEVPNDNSFINVLFNDNYSDNFYRYLYRRVMDRSTWPSTVLTRLMIDPKNANYFRCDGNDPNLHNFNLYGLRSEDLTMLNHLTEYRHIGTTNHSTVDYHLLTTNLSRMIYIYLDVKLHNNNSKYPAGISMASQGDVLEYCYEVYLIENIFNQISNTGTWG